MLKKKLTDEDVREMQKRSLNDTRYATRFLKEFIEENLEFAPGSGKKKVFTVNGAVTAYLRYRWGLHKDREENVLHHAIDAAVVACVTDGMTKRISDYSKYKEIYRRGRVRITGPETGEVLSSKYSAGIDKIDFPRPSENFREELLVKKNKIFVSRMPKRKSTGAAHKDTIRSIKDYNPNSKHSYTVIRKSVKSLKKSDLENLCCKASDPALYNIIKDRLNNEKSLQEPIYKPKKDNTNGPCVRHVKVRTNDISGIEINRGLAANDSMIRLDLFRKNGKNYFVPIYTSDVVKDDLPDQIIPHPKKESGKIDGSYQFLFSLHYNDLIKIKSNKFEEFGYYVGYNISTGALSLIHHDAASLNMLITKGGRKVEIEKYQVDILGNYHRVGNEKRKNYTKRWHKGK